MKITYPSKSEAIVAIVRTEKKRYEVRMVINNGLTYMYFKDDSGDTWGRHAGYVMLADVLSDIGRLESKTINKSELGVNAR